MPVPSPAHNPILWLVSLSTWASEGGRFLHLNSDREIQFYIPAQQKNWPSDVQSKFREINKLAKEPKLPLKAWGERTRRRGRRGRRGPGRGRDGFGPMPIDGMFPEGFREGCNEYTAGNST